MHRIAFALGLAGAAALCLAAAQASAQPPGHAKRAHASAAERRPAHAGPTGAHGQESGPIDQLLGADERTRRARSRREREEKLTRLREQKRQQNDAADDLVGMIVEKRGAGESRARN